MNCQQYGHPDYTVFIVRLSKNVENRTAKMKG